MSLQEQVTILEQAEERFSRERWPFLQYLVVSGLNLSVREAFNNDKASMNAVSDLLPLAEASLLLHLMLFAERLGVAPDYAESAVTTYALSYAHRIRTRFCKNTLTWKGKRL